MTSDERVFSGKGAVFLDRDGVINRKMPPNQYVSKIAEFEILPRVIEALKILTDLGFPLIVVTNQRGINRGLMSEEDLIRVHEHMADVFRKNGISLAGVYFCPHDEHERCPCRKPEPGMILRAARDLLPDLTASYMVGDSATDIEAGRRAGLRTVSIGEVKHPGSDLGFHSLYDFALFLRDDGDEAYRSGEQVSDKKE